MAGDLASIFPHGRGYRSAPKVYKIGVCPSRHCGCDEAVSKRPMITRRDKHGVVPIPMEKAKLTSDALEKSTEGLGLSATNALDGSVCGIVGNASGAVRGCDAGAHFGSGA